jgi:hypothetical protein
MDFDLKALGAWLAEAGLMNKAPADMAKLDIIRLCELVHESTHQADGWGPPYFNNAKELIIPFNAPAKYRYWSHGGQPLKQTLKEIGASPEIIERYCPAYLGEGLKPKTVKD